MENKDNFFLHPSAILEESAVVGSGTKVWHFAHIRKGAKIGNDCIVAKGVYIDSDVKIGDRVKIQNNVSIYKGVEIESGVFIGPHVCFTNDKNPRAVDENGNLKNESAWSISNILIGEGVSIGANSTIVCGITIGKWAMIGAGSVVTKSVPPFALVIGNPGRIVGIVSKNGNKVCSQYKAGEYQDQKTSELIKILPEWLP